MSTTTVAHIYNPKNQSKEELINSFVVRRNLFERLFKEIKSSKMKHPEQHYLITGKRGMGKTTLLYRLGYEIENDPKLNTWLIPIIFNEEEYSIRKLCRFWERTIDLLEEKHPSLFTELADEMQDLRKIHKDDEQYERILFERLEKTMQSKGKKLLLFIDNFGDIFNKFSDSEAHRLRKILQTCAELRIMAASSVVLEAFYEYNHPFYEFFKEVKLEGLSEDETKSLLLKLGETYKEESVRRIVQEQPGRVEALRRITGGVIRTIVLLFEIFVDDEDGSAIRDLMGILDRVTPLYKHRMDDLPAVQQEIVEAIAFSWDAMSVGEIAEQTRMESKLVSAHLTPLVNNGIVSKITTDKKNHLYQLDERFFNIWYLMRFGSKYDRRRVVWLVRFFEEWCDGNSLEERIKCHISALKSKPYDPHSAWFVTEALAGTKHIQPDLQHELLMETRLYLSKLNNELYINLSKSDIELLELASKAYLDNHINNAWEIFDQLNSKDIFLKEVKKSVPDFALDNYKMFPETVFSLALARVAIFEMKSKNLLNSEFWLSELFIKGESIGLIKVANYFQHDLKDLQKAEEWLLKATEKGDTNAMFMLGIFGDNINNDFLKAEEWLLKAAEKDNLSSIFLLGFLYHYFHKDLQKAEKWYLKAAEKGSADTMNNLGILHQFEYKDPQKAEEWYLKAAEKGNAEAMKNLGILYQFQHKNLQKAEEWYLKAAEKSNAEAMFRIGYIFSERNDLQKSKDWYIKAAEKGNASAMNNLGHLYDEVDNDLVKAEEWYAKAAEKGIARAMSNLGLLYKNEHKDLVRAEEWYLKSAEADLSNANTYAWFLLENKKSKTQALDFALKAYQLEKDNAFVAHTLACIQLWNNQYEAAESIADKFMYDTDLMEKNPEEFIIFFQLLLAKNRHDFLYNAFTSEKGEEVHLQDRFKPIWYALLKRMNHPDFLRMGSELEETVNEILEQVEQMAVDYA